MIRRPFFCLGLIMVLLLGLPLAGCGQKGDLYLPDEPAKQEQEEEKKS